MPIGASSHLCKLVAKKSHSSPSRSEREMSKGMRPVDEHGDSSLAAEPHDVAHRQDLPAQVRDVGKLDDASLGCDRTADALHELAGIAERNRERNALDDDPLSAGTLVPRGEHARIVLVGDDHLVAPLEVDSQDQSLHSLGGISRDRQLLGIAAELPGERAADGLDPRFEHLPHMVRRQLVAEPQIADHLFEDVRWRRADTAVIEVGKRPIAVEAALNLRPVIFVTGQIARRIARCIATGQGSPRHGVRAEQRPGGRHGQTSEELAPRPRSTPALTPRIA